MVSHVDVLLKHIDKVVRKVEKDYRRASHSLEVYHVVDSELVDLILLESALLLHFYRRRSDLLMVRFLENAYVDAKELLRQKVVYGFFVVLYRFILKPGAAFELAV